MIFPKPFPEHQPFSSLKRIDPISIIFGTPNTHFPSFSYVTGYYCDFLPIWMLCLESISGKEITRTILYHSFDLWHLLIHWHRHIHHFHKRKRGLFTIRYKAFARLVWNKTKSINNILLLSQTIHILNCKAKLEAILPSQIANIPRVLDKIRTVFKQVDLKSVKIEI